MRGEGGQEEVPARLHTHNINPPSRLFPYGNKWERRGRGWARLRPTTTKAACSSWSVRGSWAVGTHFGPLFLSVKINFCFQDLSSLMYIFRLAKGTPYSLAPSV
uniref:Uncharacterized protein n=1 Tax=Morchella importuna TaxID=1174673 RepID=A0A650AFB3_9PEZI|nr:hypothetical protein [Morchella importuna]QGN66722.1 hypothetical protein [Morchella importuna]